MSFLATRAISSVNKATADPAAEKELREQQRQAKEQIRTYKNKISDERNMLVATQSKKQINKSDADILSKLLDDLTKYLDDPNTVSLTQHDLMDKWDDTFNTDKYIGLAITAFEPGSYKDAKGSRFDLQKSLKVAKQAKHDAVTAKEETRKLLDEYVTKLQQFADTNVYSRPSTYDIFMTSIKEDYFEKNKNDEFKTAIAKADEKIVKNFELDFEEKPGAPVANADARAEAAKVEKFQNDAAKDQFSVSRLLSTAVGKAASFVILGTLLFLACLGSSMAVNLNMYKSTPFKVLYAIYGFLFGFVVVPYVLLYRWWWLGKQPTYFGFLPFIPGFFVRPQVQFLLGWLTYKKDPHMGDTQEWIEHAKKLAEEAAKTE